MIGILGGTFDPIHHGHLRTALEIAEHFALTDMRLIPGNIPPHRPQPLASAAQRLAMLQAAIASEPRLRADARELERTGFSYSVDTLAAIRAECGAACPLLFALGFDAFQHLQSWHRWEMLLQLAHLVVVHRPGYGLPPEGWYTAHLTQDKTALQQAAAGCVYPLAVTALTISATDIRQRLQQGNSPRYLLPDAVLDYIQTHQLYCET